MPTGSIFVKVFNIISSAIKLKRAAKSKETSFINQKTSFWLDYAKKSVNLGGQYSNKSVNGVKTVFELIPFLLFFIVYWCVFGQLSTLCYAQGCQMDIQITNSFQIPIATMSLFNVIPIIIIAPLMDRCILPCLRKYKIEATMLQRIGVGFIFACLAMIYAGTLEIYRKNAPLTDIPSSCFIDNDNILVSDISIFAQIPTFFLFGTSECFASITGIEFFFSQAPIELRSVLSALFLVTTGLGAWLVGIFIFIVNSFKSPWITEDLNDGYLEYYFFMIAIFTLIVFLLYIIVAIKYKYKHNNSNDNNDQEMDSLSSDFDGILDAQPYNNEFE